MFASRIFLALFTALFMALSANAALITLFSDTECKNAVESVNVWDNTCLKTGGFQSFVITYQGGDSQRIRAYTRNDCVAPESACVWADQLVQCIRATGGDGASHALSSYVINC